MRPAAPSEADEAARRRGGEADREGRVGVRAGGRRDETEEGEGGFGEDGEGETEGGLDDDWGEDVRHDVAVDDARRARPDGPSRVDEHLAADGEDGGAGDPGEDGGVDDADGDHR